MLSDNIMDYYVVAQGKTSIPGVDDGEELELTDVRPFTKTDEGLLDKLFANALPFGFFLHFFKTIWDL